MTQVNETSRPARTPRRPSAKPHGQWKVDGTAPLNHNEEFKQQDDGLNVRERIEQVYAREGFDSIPSDDLHGRFRWWGLYTQRRQGIDGGKTATLEPHELEDRYFMLRVRIDGGDLTTEQLRVIGGISTDFGRDTADITDRQNVQLHWIRVEDVPEIWRRLESVGLSTTEACGDVPRVILGSPVAGIAADEIIDPTPVIREIADRWIGDLEISNLPRKFKTAITGHPSQDVVHEINDVSLIGVVHPELGPGYDLWVGGGLSTKARLADRIGAFVSAERAPEVWHAVVSIFRDYGFRRNRNRARLKFLVAKWGIEKFRQVLEEEYLDKPLLDGIPLEVEPGSRDHLGVHRQKDGKFYVGVKPTVGHATGEQLIAIADVAEKFGISRIRTTPMKELLFLDVEEEDIPALSRALDETGLYSQPSEFRRGVISCTGLEFCKLAHVTTKARAIELVDILEDTLGDLDVPISIALNGCPNACARSQVSDIGLKGQIVSDSEGNRVEGFQVHLGGALGLSPDWGRKLRGHKVVADEVPEYVIRLVNKYKEQREDGEQFRHWVLRAKEEDLQ
mgnify:CR=1 FL=1